MATESQRRLYEAMEKQPYPAGETFAGRKGASDLGAKYFAAEHLSYGSNLRGDPVELNRARRRRIYENEYNRPYPSNKRIDFRCEYENCSAPLSVISLKTTSVISPEITPWPSNGVRVVNQDWTYNSALSDDELSSPHDVNVRAPKNDGASTFYMPSLKTRTSVISPEITPWHSHGVVNNRGWTYNSALNDDERSSPHDENMRAPKSNGGSTFYVPTLKTTSVISPEIASNPTIGKVNQVWAYSPALSDDEWSSPHDEKAEDIAPRMLWTTTYNGLYDKDITLGENDLIAELRETDFDVEVSLDTRRSIGATSLMEPGSGKMTNMVSFSNFSTALSIGSNDMTSTSDRPSSKAGKSAAKNSSSVKTPTCHRISEFFLPSTPVKMVSTPSTTEIVQDSLQTESGVQKRSGLRKKRRDHDSYRTLHNFLKNADEETLKLYVDDYKVPVFDRLVELFYGNTSLKKIIISRSEEGGKLGSQQRTLGEMECLFEAVRCLPNLKTIIVWNATVDILRSLVDNLPRRLAKLCLQVVDGSIPNSILDVIAQKENLENVQLEVQESMELGRLLNSSSISTLRVCGMWYDMDKHHMQGFADTLYSNLDSPLKHLDIQPTMNLSSWKSLATALRFNTTLRTLRVSFLGKSLAERDAAATELAELIHSNTILRRISNYACETVVVSVEIANDVILEALRENKTLQKFHFFQEEPVFWVAKHAVLTRNKETFGEEGDLGHSLVEQYVNFTHALPSMKAKICGDC